MLLAVVPCSFILFMNLSNSMACKTTCLRPSNHMTWLDCDPGAYAALPDKKVKRWYGCHGSALT
eukprot:363384-Chlamydomonas_euryale.AAC.13